MLPGLRKKISVILILIAVTAASVYGAVTVNKILGRSTFYDGIAIDDINISGLTLPQAKQLVVRSINDKYDIRSPKLTYKDRSWDLKLEDISYTFKFDDLVERAYTAGRSGTVLKRLLDIADYRMNGLTLNTDATYERKKIKTLLTDIKREIDSTESSAAMNYKNGKIEFTADSKGAVMDVEENFKEVEARLEKRDFGDIPLKVKVIRPKITYEDIADMKNFISSFSTSFNAGDENRSYNIRLACQKINNTILMPGEVFSMAGTLGPRTIENGYKDAHVIYKNELINGPGGGVCQVTSTLYGAVLRANAEVIERSPHSLPLAYVQPGQDATIAEDYLDFKFRNSFDHPVAICTETGRNTLTIKIVSTKPNDYVVKLKSQILEEYAPPAEEVIIDSGVPAGQRVVVEAPKRGYRVAVYKELYSKNGELLDREKISEDVYKATRGQVKVNPNRFIENSIENNEISDEH